MLTRGVNLKGAFDTLTLWKNATSPNSYVSYRTYHCPIETFPARRSIACRLPIELLQTIFLLLAAIHAPGKDHHPSQSHTWWLLSPPSRPSWIYITHVCRHWRAAALGLRELWSVISPGLSISWAQAMMERSSPLPVHVDIRISSGSANSSSSPATMADGLHPLAASELLFVASRIRTLRLAGLRVDILHVLNRLRSPSSHLESLTLSIYDGGGPPVSLPASVFGGADKAPKLRRLTFATDTWIRAPLWLLGGITEFTTGADITLPELLETLGAMPQLQILRVQHCRAVWDEEGTTATGLEGPPLRRVTLPHLQLIAFRDTTPRRFVILVPRIDAPPTVRKHLYWRSWAVASWERWEGMLNAMRAFIPRDSGSGARDGGLRAARVRGGPARGSFCVWSRSAASGEDENEKEEDALFLFRIDWTGSPVDPRGETLLEHSSPFFHLDRLCAQLPAMCVTTLTIEPEPEPDGEQVMSYRDVGIVSASTAHWECLLQALESVQSLRLQDGDRRVRATGISSSLLHTIVSVSASDSLLPHLQKLHFMQCDVRCAAQPTPADGVVLWNLKRLALRGGSAHGHAGFAVEQDGGAGRGAGKELVALVRRRVGLEVILVGCDVDEEALDELRKHAQVSIGEEWVYV